LAACHEAGVGVGDLIGRGAAQLTYAFEHEVEPVHVRLGHAAPAGVRRSTPRSAPTSTTANAPSVSRQLSNRQSGSEIHRASMYCSRVSGLSCIVAAGLRLACLRNATATLARCSRPAPN